MSYAFPMLNRCYIIKVLWKAYNEIIKNMWRKMLMREFTPLESKAQCTTFSISLSKMGDRQQRHCIWDIIRNWNYSLHDCLYLVPCLLLVIFNILLRFRFCGVGLVADIKQAFLNIEIDVGYRDFPRFLWVEDLSEKWMCLYKFLGVFGGLTNNPFYLGPSSPFLFEATINPHTSKYIVPSVASEVLKNLLREMHVDESLWIVDEGFEFYASIVLKALKNSGWPSNPIFRIKAKP